MRRHSTYSSLLPFKMVMEKTTLLYSVVTLVVVKIQIYFI